MYKINYTALYFRVQYTLSSNSWLIEFSNRFITIHQVTSGMPGALCLWQVIKTVNGQSSGFMIIPAAWAQVGWNAVEQRPWEHWTQQPFTSLFIRFLQYAHFYQTENRLRNSGGGERLPVACYSKGSAEEGKGGRENKPVRMMRRRKVVEGRTSRRRHKPEHGEVKRDITQLPVDNFIGLRHHEYYKKISYNNGDKATHWEKKSCFISRLTDKCTSYTGCL